MLILARKDGEAIRVGDVRIVVVDRRGSFVRLGIDAPKDVPVHREEVYQAIKRKGAESDP